MLPPAGADGMSAYKPKPHYSYGSVSAPKYSNEQLAWLAACAFIADIQRKSKETKEKQ